MKHREYNLEFVNELIDNRIIKSCELSNENSNPSYVILSTYLIYLQYKENIDDFVLPEIENALSGKPFSDISFESINVDLGPADTNFAWNGWTEIIPTSDLKIILKEYGDFLQSPPLNGKIKKPSLAQVFRSLGKRLGKLML